MTTKPYTCGACGAKLSHKESYRHELFECPKRPGAPTAKPKGA